MLKDSGSVSSEDLGAGSSSRNDERRIKDIAKLSLSSPHQCRILYRMVKYLDVARVLEFGSCLGVSAAYMAQAGAEVISMEGNRDLYHRAVSSFSSVGSGIDFRHGAFENILPRIIDEEKPFDLIFIDGNHRKEPTLRYFDQVRPLIKENTVLIFDDIHWSEEMESAWFELKANPEITMSLDLFWCGIVFFRKGLSGEHLSVRY